MAANVHLNPSIMSVRFNPLKLVGLRPEAGEKAFGTAVFRKITEKQQERRAVTKYSFRDTVLGNQGKRPSFTREEFLELYPPGLRPAVNEILQSNAGQRTNSEK